MGQAFPEGLLYTFRLHGFGHRNQYNILRFPPHPLAGPCYPFLNLLYGKRQAIHFFYLVFSAFSFEPSAFLFHPS
jgi:hypothetical protein